MANKSNRGDVEDKEIKVQGSTNNVSAEGLYKDDEFLLLEGSELSKETSESFPEFRANTRKQVIEAEAVKESGNAYVLQEDMVFNSPSDAGSIVAGRQVNGLTFWRTEDGERLTDVIEGDSEERSFYRIILGRENKHAKESRQKGFVGVDYDIKENLSEITFDDKSEFNEACVPIYLEYNPDKTDQAGVVACSAIYAVSKEMSVGDVVLSPNDDGDYFVGEVSSGYEFKSEASLPHQRSVNWFDQTIDPSDMSQPLQTAVESRTTVCNLNDYAEELTSLIDGKYLQEIMPEYNLPKELIEKAAKYKKLRGSKHWNEEYKWKTLLEVHNKLTAEPVTKENVAEKIEMLRDYNPQSGSFCHWSSLDNLKKLAEKDSGKIMEAVHNLFDDSINLAERISKLRQVRKDIDENLNLGTPLFGYLLAAHDYNQYPLYKDSVLRHLNDEYPELGLSNYDGLGEKYENFTKLCRQAGRYLNEELGLDDTEVAGVSIPAGHKALDGQDFCYCLATLMNPEHDQYYKNRDGDMYEIIKKFLDQAQTDDLKTQDYPDSLGDLEMRVSFGQGNQAMVPWTAFLSSKNEVRDGIYPVYLYYKEENALMLAYGVSETNDPNKEWSKEVRENHPKIFSFFDEDVPRYGDSFVKEAYKVEVGDEISLFKNYESEEQKKVTAQEFSDDFSEILKEYKELSVDYFWLNRSQAKYQLLLENEVADVATHTDKGNNRRIISAFNSIQEGDVVYIYLASPAKELKAKARVQEGKHENENEEEVITIKLDEEFDNPVPYSNIEDKVDFNDLLGKVLLPLSDSTQHIITNAISSNMNQKDLTIEETELQITKKETINDLFIREEKFDQVLSLLDDKRQVILQGPPGTGKTYIANKMAKYITKSEDRIESVQFHSSYSYEDFIEGYRPTESGNFKLEDGIFKTFCDRARHAPDQTFVFLIDEINRGNLSKVFGELMYLLEYREKSVALTYSKEQFSIPKNVKIIGTMNTADRSLAIMDYALRRRFHFVDQYPNLTELEGWLEAHTEVDANKLVDQVKQMNQKIAAKMDSKEYNVGHSYFMKAGMTAKDLDAVLEYEVRPLLKEYFYDEPERVEEIMRIFDE